MLIADRNAFKKPLIYDPVSLQWRGTASYIRNKPACVLRHDTLPVQYEQLETLFGKYACVRTTDCDDILAEIQGLGLTDSPETILRAKDLIDVLDTTLKEKNYVLPHSGFAEKLLKCRFLPARIPEGITLCNANECYIPDETAIEELFASHFPMVEATHAEIAQLRPLIDSLGLQKRLLSAASLRYNEVSCPVVNDVKSEEIRQKVQWICKLSDKPTEEMLEYVSKTTVWDVHTITAGYVLEETKAKREFELRAFSALFSRQNV